MVPVPVRRLQGFRPEADRGHPVMRVAVDGLRPRAWLPGLDPQAAFRRPEGGYLLLSADDVPYEEVLNAILIDERGRMIDSRSIGAAYATGRLRDLRVEGPHAVSFSFFEGDRWVAEVATGVLKPPPPWLPRLLRRGLRVKRLAGGLSR